MALNDLNGLSVPNSDRRGRRATVGAELSSREDRQGSATSRSPQGSKSKANDRERRPGSPTGNSESRGNVEGLYEEIEDWSLLKERLTSEEGLIMPSEFID